MTKMEQERFRYKKAKAAFALTFLSCALGLFFCLAKSPQAKSETYLAAAHQAMETRDDALAVRAAYEAARLNPASSRAWFLLEALLRQNGHLEAAHQAQAIAARLQKDNAPTPLYAMPAELRLSLLSLAGGEAP